MSAFEGRILKYSLLGGGAASSNRVCHTTCRLSLRATHLLRRFFLQRYRVTLPGLPFTFIYACGALTACSAVSATGLPRRR
jgi:hypothetical protein